MSKRRHDPESSEVFKEIGNATEHTDYFPDLKGSYYHSAWASPEAYANYIKKLDRKKSWDRDGDHWDSGDKDWYGTRNMDEALKLATEGWPEGVKKVEQLRNKILAMHPISPRTKKYGIVGEVPNVPRAVSGNPMNMLQRSADKSRKRPIITLMSDMSASCGVNPNKISNRAAALAVLIDHIEAAGFSCEVLSIAITRGYDKKGYHCATSVMVKQSHQPVDIGRLAFGLGHASLFRRMMFADWYSDSINKKLGFGLGHIFEMDTTEVRERDVYYVPSAQKLGKYFKTDEDSATMGIEMLIKHLQSQGCPAFPKMEEKELEAFNRQEKERGMFDYD